MVKTRMLILEKLKKIADRINVLEQQLGDPDIIKDVSRFQKLSKELALLRPVAEVFETYKKVERETEEVKRGLEERGLDKEMQAMYREEAAQLEKRRGELQTELEDLLLRGSDPDSTRDVLLEIRAGTGGEEAALFSADLFRMYSRYAAAHGLRVEVMEESSTGKGGYKELIVSISGKHTNIIANEYLVILSSEICYI